MKMFTENELKRLLGDDFDTEQTPETMAYAASLDYATEVAREMERQGLSLKDLAERMGVKPPTLCEKLNGKANLTFKSAAHIAKALGCGFEAPKLCNKPSLKASVTIEYENAAPQANCAFGDGSVSLVASTSNGSIRKEGSRVSSTRYSFAA